MPSRSSRTLHVSSRCLPQAAAVLRTPQRTGFRFSPYVKPLFATPTHPVTTSTGPLSNQRSATLAVIGELQTQQLVSLKYLPGTVCSHSLSITPDPSLFLTVPGISLAKNCTTLLETPKIISRHAFQGVRASLTLWVENVPPSIVPALHPERTPHQRYWPDIDAWTTRWDEFSAQNLYKILPAHYGV